MKHQSIHGVKRTLSFLVAAILFLTNIAFADVLYV